MMFLPELDEKKTRANAKRKLKEIPRWQLLANTKDKQRVTTTLSHEPKAKTGKNNSQVERLALTKVSAEQELEEIKKAIDLLTEPIYKEILKCKYYKRQKDFITFTELDYSEAMFYILLNKALIEFAFAYRGRILLELK
ncbi:ArpU family phage packaging/lysis transcriptional regulator [Streptococcus saliviloxodontae]|uniref:ArpU family phage transcriptional regulator n=1 Tax=Streptococcus saliviloxodontae TaxID=1349416 RepID=A0ABS2PKQ9_9STRE|nr:ArpU family phage packaging/lysis transcriptional regulator [Streptococcus saliviloxodontae]MBM7635575.1 ArpU family phage transcriptional regulator [Streptococcus saliviloxodontae]